MNILKVLMAVFPALALFLVSVFFIVSPMAYDVEKNVIRVYAPGGNYQGALFFLKNYLAVYEFAEYYATYWDLVSRVFSLFVAFYIVALPLVLVGFFKDNVLNSWTALLLIGSFSALVTPFFALDFWHRWMFMLAYPFSFYAINGITKVVRSSRKFLDSTFRRAKLRMLSEIAVKMILILPFFSGLVFMATTMQDSAVPLCDLNDTIEVMQWLDTQMDDDSTLLAHVVFLNWARLYLDKRHIIVPFKEKIERAVDVALQGEFDYVYLVWWNEKIKWYVLNVPREFVSVFGSGRISVFRLML